MMKERDDNHEERTEKGGNHTNIRLAWYKKHPLYCYACCWRHECLNLGLNAYSSRVTSWLSCLVSLNKEGVSINANKHVYLHEWTVCQHDSWSIEFARSYLVIFSSAIFEFLYSRKYAWIGSTFMSCKFPSFSPSPHFLFTSFLWSFRGCLSLCLCLGFTRSE